MRAIAHVHSDWSYDGTLSLPEIAKLFGRLGYHAVLMSEHDRGFNEERWDAYRRACVAASSTATVLVPGMEYSDSDNNVHLLVWGSDRFLGEGRDSGPLVAEAKLEGATVVLAHPRRRRAAERLQASTVALLDGVEIWNRKYDGVAPSPTALELKREHPGLRSFVGLDFHTRRQLFPLTVMLDLPPAGAGPREILAGVGAGRMTVTALGVPERTFSAPSAMVAFGQAERTRRVARDRVRALQG